VHLTIQLAAVGRAYYDVYNNNPGTLTAAAIKAAALAAPSGAHVGGGQIDAAAPMIAYSDDTTGLPQGTFYRVYVTAESSGVLDDDSEVKVYDRVLPRRLAMLEIPASVYAAHVIRYYVSYPPGYYDYTPATKAPVLVFFHGGGEVTNSAANAQTGFFSGATYLLKAALPKWVDEGYPMPFVTISPQCNYAFFACIHYAGTAAAYLNATFDLVKSSTHKSIDTRRIYVLGQSSGGAAAYQAALLRPKDIAAVFTANTTDIMHNFLTPSETAQVCSTIVANKIPVWSVHNAPDSLEAIWGSQKMVAAINGCAGVTRKAILTTYTGTRWPAANDASHPAPAWKADEYNHDSLSYSIGSYFYHYSSATQYTTPTPIEPKFTSDLAIISATNGTPLSSLWDWFKMYSKPSPPP
jgi:hypothetical protein